MAKVGIGLTVGVTLPIALASKGFISMGSAANELQNRFNVTFGDMAEDVNDWSNSLSAAFGRSALDVKGFVQSFNTMLTPVGLGAEATRAMAKELTALTFDFGSFADLAPEEAFAKLQSGLAGMSRPLLKHIGEISATTVKTFALKIGIIEVGEQMTEAQKIVGRFGLIMERMSEAMGDAIRTGGEWANQIVNMMGKIFDISAAIGQAMIPTLLPLLRLFTKHALGMGKLVAEWFKAHKVISGFIVVIVGLTAGLGPLLLITTAMIGLWLKWKISAGILKLALFALRFQIRGVSISAFVMNRNFVVSKAVAGLFTGALVRLKLVLAGVAAHFKIASLSSISFATIWSGAAGIIAGAAALVTGAFRLMWAAILGPVGIAIIAITALVFLLEHVLAKNAMKAITEETNAMSKAMKGLSGGAAGSAAGGAGDFGRTVSTPILSQLAAGGEGFPRIFGGVAGSLGIKPKGDQLVAGEIRTTNEILRELVSQGPASGVVLS
ncbi:MAG: hypothetical protein IID41_13800 [Planctomycetes bacterium]|nr:hypothetical protein [Planctomycetota bacterium]